ncbi:DUF5802 family protein [Halogranum rubrum]|uniref:Uncharacterized protein n=1 Tax=Halogranum salarium B-1 TaxID=1210908 RepID=J2ZD16_9EURY|nr:DUF5802 family protein [Halogranum salarium]EJN58570.1 hypothetical protein HSB1_30480 [Halogranum salarium B-1]
MFEQFSSGYYLGEMFVEPHDCEGAFMHRADHELVNKQLYASGEGVERLDTPLVMKLGGTHFPVLGDDGIPAGTLVVPRTVASDDSLPTRREVFLAKAERASELLRYAGYEFGDAA